MRFRSIILAALVAASFVAAAAGTRTVFNNVSELSGSSGPIDTTSCNALNVQVCGTAFSGAVVVSQGPTLTTLAAVKTLTLTTYTGCDEYYVLDLATYTQIDYTRTSGSMSVYLECLK